MPDLTSSNPVQQHLIDPKEVSSFSANSLQQHFIGEDGAMSSSLLPGQQHPSMLPPA